FIDKLAAGIYSFLPLGLRVHNKICNIIRQEMDIIGGQEILMPALTPKKIWQATDRWDNFDALFKLEGSNGKEYALGATHEEVVTPLTKKFVFSYNDLSVAIYQIQTKFRNEPRAKAGLIRGREFSMKDLYSFHADEEALNKYYKIVQKSYFKIFERCGLLNITYLTYATGGAFSKYSHEFQTLCEAGEDTIHICDQCKVAVNQEIIEDHPNCPGCKNSKLHKAKAIEVGNIFKLGNRFSKPFDFKYTDEKGKEHDVIMGCYGLGPSRLMAAIVEVFHDERGIIWPEQVAPYRVHLLSFKQDKKAEKAYNELLANDVEVLYDDRDIHPGEKLAEADLIGCPYRLVVSEASLGRGGIELKLRSEDKTQIIKLNKIVDYFKK
ncbi:MAG: aminoacyl--tRNA ligase-related protein, partial [bacterium]